MLSFEWKITCDEFKLLMASSKTLYSLEIFFFAQFHISFKCQGPYKGAKGVG